MGAFFGALVRANAAWAFGSLRGPVVTPAVEFGGCWGEVWVCVEGGLTLLPVTNCRAGPMQGNIAAPLCFTSGEREDDDSECPIHAPVPSSSSSSSSSSSL